MKRTIVRFQLVLLAIAVVLIVYRVADGTPAPAGTLVLHDLHEGHLAMRTLHVTGQPQPFALDATGSFATPQAQRLEAYAWLVDRATRQVVWQMTPEQAERSRSTLATVRDTIVLGPGTYDAYFTTLGSGENTPSSGFLSGGRRWQNNAPHWRFVAKALGDAALARSERHDDEEIGPKPDGLLWSTAPDRGREARATLSVSRPARVAVYAVGAFTPSPTPALAIVPVGGDTPAWTLPVAETAHAGGASINRAFNGTVTLQPGLYQVVHQPSRGGWNNWRLNPPLDPAAWGVTLSTPDTGAVTRFAPFENVQPALGIRQPGDDVDRYVTFRVPTRTPVYVYGMGEMTSENSRYDYGWIEAEDGVRVWEMEYEDSEPAGGSSKNRQVEAWITLDPGTYKLRFRSDDSHAYGDYNSEGPDHAERWGIALFTSRPGMLVKGDEGDNGFGGAVSEAVEDIAAQAEQLAEDVSASLARSGVPEPPPSEGAIVALLRTGSRQSLTEPFEVRQAGAYHLYATGELVGRERYDYATLHNEKGELVWEMTEQNTRPAGGSARNRVFDGVVQLPPGRYTLRYQSDGSHAFGDFAADEAPAFPHAWGVILKRNG